MLTQSPPQMTRPRELALCIALCALKNNDFATFRSALNNVRLDDNFQEEIVKKLCAKTESGEVPSDVCFQWTMGKLVDSDMLVVEREFYDKMVLPILRSTRAKIESATVCNGTLVLPNKTRIEHFVPVESTTLRELGELIDTDCKAGDQGYISFNEVEKALYEVRKWKKTMNIHDGEGVVVVDAYNLGTGGLPQKHLVNQLYGPYKTVVLVVRGRDFELAKKLSPNVLSCSRMSSDDIVIIRAAMEFGNQANLISNDRYRDHKKRCEKLTQAWSEWFIDVVYRCDPRTGVVESKRNFNRRMRRLDDGAYLVPVLTEDPNIPTFDYVVATPPPPSSSSS